MTIARHIFHATTSGPDRIAAWQESSGEPAFVWGRHSNQFDGYWFGSVKVAFRKWIEATSAASISVYHDGVGADAFGPLDPSPQKLLVLHHWYPRWERNFEWMLRCTGKVAVPGEEFGSLMRERFSWIPEKYIHCIEPPLLSDSLSGEGGIGSKDRTGIWLHGRPWKRHGNRLRSIIDRWPAGAGQLEIIASGKSTPHWARKPHVKWSPDLPLEFALLRLHTWDSTLLLNDYSLDSPWLMRALELGCFPLIPDGSGVARAGGWLEDSAPQPYEWGNVSSAVDLLGEWRANRSTLDGAFRLWTERLLPDATAFSRDWEAAKSAMLNSRPPKLRQRKPIASLYPVAMYERVQRLRAGA